jgi:hypothetical protein
LIIDLDNVGMLKQGQGNRQMMVPGRMDYIPAPNIVPGMMVPPNMNRGFNMQQQPHFKKNINYNAQFIPKQPQQKQKFEKYEKEVKDDPNQVDEAAGQIYEIIDQKYPEYAGKITGMIVEMGLQEMQKLLSRTDQLDNVIDEAYKVK